MSKPFSPEVEPDAGLRAELEAFATRHRIRKGWLSLLLVITDLARAEGAGDRKRYKPGQKGLPLDADVLLTKGEGQVSRLGMSAVQAILERHGITRILAKEGGRTSRKNIAHMRAYVALLNKLHSEGRANIDAIENWVVQKVREYFASQPFVLRLDPGKSIHAAVRDLLNQALARQKESQGTMYVGTVVQHLLGAKIQLALGDPSIEFHGVSVADESSRRNADFEIGDSAIHATVTPGESLMRKCQENIDSGKKPIIVTLSEKVSGAQMIANQSGLEDRVDIMGVEQFMVVNLLERGAFKIQGAKDTARAVIERYNAIVDLCETDPSLKVEIR